MRDTTRYIQGPEADTTGFASVSVPIHRASTVVFPNAAAFADRYLHFYDGYTYGLYGTPTSLTLAERFSELAGGGRTILTPSGQSALTLVLSALLRPGDRALVTDACYGPVRAYCNGYLKEIGVEVEFYDPMLGEGVASLLTDRTRLILVESPGSVTMEVQDLSAIAEAAHARGALVVADNTWASPLLFKPLDKGADISIEALSKHIGGHGDLLMGAVTVRDEGLFRHLKDATRLFGLGVSSDDCALALRGMQTAALRIERASATALTLAQELRGAPGIALVLHPSFPECPGHAVFKRDFAGAAGVFSVVLVPEARKQIPAFIDQLELFKIGASWGGTQSLVTPQDPTSTRTAVPWTSGPVVRFSVGLEASEDILEDVRAALPKLMPVTAGAAATAA